METPMTSSDDGHDDAALALVMRHLRIAIDVYQEQAALTSNTDDRNAHRAIGLARLLADSASALVAEDGIDNIGQGTLLLLCEAICQMRIRAGETQGADAVQAFDRMAIQCLGPVWENVGHDRRSLN